MGYASLSLGRFRLHQPKHGTGQVDRGCCGDVLQVRLGQTDVPRATQAKGTRALRDSAFDSCACLIAFFELRGLLSVTCGQQGIMLRFWLEGEDTWSLPGTGAATRHDAGRAIVSTEADLKDGLALSPATCPKLQTLAE